MAFPASFKLSSRPSFSTFNGLGKDSNLVILFSVRKKSPTASSPSRNLYLLAGIRQLN